jgi:hypothetical protein
MNYWNRLILTIAIFWFAADIFTDSLTNSILSSWMDATSEIGKIQGLLMARTSYILMMMTVSSIKYTYMYISSNDCLPTCLKKSIIFMTILMLLLIWNFKMLYRLHVNHKYIILFFFNRKILKLSKLHCRKSNLPVWCPFVVWICLADPLLQSSLHACGCSEDTAKMFVFFKRVDINILADIYQFKFGNLVIYFKP